MASKSRATRDISVGIDIGTSSVKGLAVSPDGTVIRSVEQRLETSTPHPGWSEQSPERWWEATKLVLEGLPSNAAGIGLSGQMHGLVALDSSDAVLRPAILWNDQRTAAEVTQIESLSGGLEGLVAATGNRALTGFTAPKLLWMRRHQPRLYERIATVMLPKDYVRLRLCGALATDVTDASGTLWFDVAKRRWSTTMTDVLDIPPGWLPPTYESAVITGTTTAGTHVAAGAGDQGAGAVGVGALKPGRASIVLGTSGVICVPQSDYRADPVGRLQASCHALASGWMTMGVTLSAAGALAWLHRILGPEVTIEQLLLEAAAWPPGVEGLTFLPTLDGERTPRHDPDARGAFAGLSVRHDRGALVRAVLEGVAFSLRDTCDLLCELSAAPQVSRVSGGGARSRLWIEILASILELSLERVAVDEGAAYGAALLGGVAGGIWADVEDAAETCVHVRETIDPRPAWVVAYREHRARYLALRSALPSLR